MTEIFNNNKATLTANNENMNWTKRTEFTFKIGKRPRRGLFYRKKVYEEWFEYAKLSPYGYPAEFGDLTKFEDFETWWRHPDCGFELFCEPVEEEPLQVVKEIDNAAEYSFLKIDLNGDPAKIKLLFKSFLKDNLNDGEVVSRAKFQPSRKAGYIKLDAIKNYRQTYIMREIDGKSRKEVLQKRWGPRAEITDEMLRTISRETQKAKLIMKQVKKGTFP